MYNTPIWGKRVEFIKLLLELKMLLKTFSVYTG
jgi:hypothetical protein